jgi:glycosyltransferase involved in cell wall biosynthesis
VPAFSVVIPSCGRPAYLAEALESVLAQTCADFECIVVDDASPEPVPVPDHDPRVRAVRRPVNGGAAAARNTGIELATGCYIAFLDDDDVWLPDRLARALAAHERAPVAVCRQSTLGAAGGPAAGRVLEGDVHDTVLDGITPHLGATSIERTVAPRFDERYRACEDVDWWLRVAAAAPVAAIAEVGLLYRVHGDARTSGGHADRVRGGELLLAEHAGYFASHPRAKAFRLKRLALSALRTGDRALARRALAASFRLRPEPRTAGHALRAFAPASREHVGG